LDPYLDERGIPILNQKWDGTQYVRITDSKKFVVLTTTTDAKIAAYRSMLNPPNDIVKPLVQLDKMPEVDKERLSALPKFKSFTIANFGSSCYFGSALHLLFLTDIRDAAITYYNAFNTKIIITDLGRDTKNAIKMNDVNATNYIDKDIIPTNTDDTAKYNVKENKVLAMYDIAKIFYEMGKKNVTATNYTTYSDDKNIFTGNSSSQEEDAEEFITNFFSYLSESLKNLFFINIDKYTFYGDGTKLRIIEDKLIFYSIYTDSYKDVPNDDIANILIKNHDHLRKMEGSDSLNEGSDYIFTYTYDSIKNLPKYFLLRFLFLTDNKNKITIINRAKIRQFIRFYDQNGIHKDYFLLGIITRYGDTAKSGHYTSTTFIKFDSTRDEMIYKLYDDAEPVITTRVLFTEEFLPEEAYIKSYGDPMPYIILYQQF
jgi:hypothetical protein